MQSELLPVERQILGSNPSLIRSGTTSYSFHFIGTITGTLKGSKRAKSKKKKIADTEGIGYERLQLNFEVNKEDRRVFLDVAPTKYLQPTIQMPSGWMECHVVFHKMLYGMDVVYKSEVEGYLPLSYLGTEFVVCMFKETQARENQIFNFIGCGTKY